MRDKCGDCCGSGVSSSQRPLEERNQQASTVVPSFLESRVALSPIVEAPPARFPPDPSLREGLAAGSLLVCNVSEPLLCVLFIIHVYILKFFFLILNSLVI